MVYVAVFFAYPLYQDFVISFENYGFGGLATGHAPFVGVDNYVAMLTSDVTLRAITNTVVFTVGSVALQFSIGFALAVYLNRQTAVFAVLRRLVLLPWVMPLVITGTIFSLIFSTTNGLANELLRGAGLIHGDIGWLSDGVLALLPFFAAVFAWRVSSALPLPADETAFPAVSPAGRAEWALLVVRSVVGAYAVELVTRAYLVTRLTTVFRSRGGAVVAAAACFAAYHLHLGLEGVIEAFVRGLAFGVAYLLLPRVWPLAFGHAGFYVLREYLAAD